jgi:hypothetical protein
MTTETTAQRCIMGSATDAPCPFPATEALPRHRGETPRLCSFHAATEPLVAESDSLGVALSLIAEWQETARGYYNEPLVQLLDRARAEFSERRARVDQVLDDLLDAERKLIRAQERASGERS